MTRSYGFATVDLEMLGVRTPYIPPKNNNKSKQTSLEPLRVDLTSSVLLGGFPNFSSPISRALKSLNCIVKSETKKPKKVQVLLSAKKVMLKPPSP